MHTDYKGKGEGNRSLCILQREPNPSSQEERIKQIKKLMNADNANAFYDLAGYYANGEMGMPQDMTKANDLAQGRGAWLLSCTLQLGYFI